MLELNDKVKTMGYNFKDTLKKEYKEACKSEMFLELVKKLKLSDEI